MPDTPVRIQRKRTKGFRLPENTVSVTRPGMWGNPFKAGRVGPLGREPLDNAGAVGFFRVMFDDEDLRLAAGYSPPSIISAFLRGKNLACFCALNQPCHADVLLELANKEPET